MSDGDLLIYWLFALGMVFVPIVALAGARGALDWRGHRRMWLIAIGSVVISAALLAWTLYLDAR